jgi:hypothetical protein
MYCLGSENITNRYMAAFLADGDSWGMAMGANPFIGTLGKAQAAVNHPAAG